MTRDIHYYSEQFSQLLQGRDTRSHPKEPAPYKPLLLLSLIELIEEGIIKENKISILIAFSILERKFKGYQKILGSPFYRQGLAQPFFHLINDGFWYLKEKPESQGVLASGEKLKTKKKLQKHIEYGYFENELFNLLLDSESREHLTNVILSRYFSQRTYLPLFQDLRLNPLKITNVKIDHD